MMVVGLATIAAAETVTLKTGEVYRGIFDKENTIVSIFDPDGTKQGKHCQFFDEPLSLTAKVSKPAAKRTDLSLVGMTWHS